MVIRPKYYDGEYHSEDLGEYEEGGNAVSLHLEKGKTYAVVADGWQNDSENAKFCIKKAAKELNGLKLASVPDKTTCVPFETEIAFTERIKSNCILQRRNNRRNCVWSEGFFGKKH